MYNIYLTRSNHLTRAHLESEAIPKAAHTLVTGKLCGEILYVLTSIESHSGYSSRPRKVKHEGRERLLKGFKMDTEDDLAIEEFLRISASSGKPSTNEQQKNLSVQNKSLLEEFYCRPSLSGYKPIPCILMNDLNRVVC